VTRPGTALRQILDIVVRECEPRDVGRRRRLSPSPLISFPDFRPRKRRWKSEGSKGSNVEVVDWGRSANELLTEQAESVLHLAGRQ